MEPFKEYVAVYAFKNEADALLELAINDIIEVPYNPVSTVVSEAPGWIRGKNRRTGVEGYFPGMISSFLKFN